MSETTEPTILQRLRELIEKVPDDLLHMNTVGEVARCGTAYCLAGWMAFDPWFRANTEMGAIALDKDGIPVDRPYALDTAGRVLGLDEDDATALMACSASVSIDPHDIPKLEVLENIDRLIAGFSAVEYAAIAEDDEDDYYDDDYEEGEEDLV